MNRRTQNTRPCGSACRFGCHWRLQEEAAAATRPDGPAGNGACAHRADYGHADSISAGDQVVLNWRTTDATSVSIDGIGDVPTTGVKTVTPSESTTYHLVARGDGGTADASAHVTVNAPPAVAVPSNTMSAEEEFKANVQDIFFDYDSYDIRSDAQATLSHDASYLASHPNIKVVIGGYCDERGSDEYNLALGQNRANAAKNCAGDGGGCGRSHPRNQLRQGEAVLHGVDRGVLAAESPRRLHDRPVERKQAIDSEAAYLGASAVSAPPRRAETAEDLGRSGFAGPAAAVKYLMYVVFHR